MESPTGIMRSVAEWCARWFADPEAKPSDTPANQQNVQTNRPVFSMSTLASTLPVLKEPHLLAPYFPLSECQHHITRPEDMRSLFRDSIILTILLSMQAENR